MRHHWRPLVEEIVGCWMRNQCREEASRLTEQHVYVIDVVYGFIQRSWEARCSGDPRFYQVERVAHREEYDDA